MAPSPSANSSSDATTNQSKISTQKYLTNCKSFYSCIYCRTHLANHDELVSRSFQGNHGRAYLFNSVVNISCGPAVQRELNTGSHAVADIFCETCTKTLGWKYEKAYVEAQKYKEGKYIIELAHVVRENRHLEFDRGEIFFGDRNSNKVRHNQRHSSLRCNLKPPSTVDSGNSSASSVSSSPTLFVNSIDEDPELMCPIYDDLFGSYSNYPNSLSLSHHNRMRRSLYLDSTPYDWKQSTASPSNQDDATMNLTSSLGSSDLSPSSSSSLPTSSSPASENSSPPNEQRYNPYQIATDNQQKSSRMERRCKHEEEDDDTNHFQFEFEADRPIEAYRGKSVPSHNKNGDNCDQLDSKLEEVTDLPTYESRSSDTESHVSFRQASGSHEQQEKNDIKVDRSDLSTIPSSSCFNTGHDLVRPLQADDSGSSSDDENFYDCNTDHVISNPMIPAPDLHSRGESHAGSN